MRKSKKFKGCIKIPLQTKYDQEELIKRSTWLGDWKTKSHIILARKRAYTINLYITDTLGIKTIETVNHSSTVTHHEFKDILKWVFEYISKEYPLIDYDNSYMTVNC